MGLTYAWQPLAPGEVFELLAGFDRPWWIAGGHALDLWLRRTTRPHEDVDVALLRRDQVALRERLADWDLRYMAGHVLFPWDGTPLELPVHELWGRRDRGSPWEVEVVLNEADDVRWIYRRDAAVSLPLERAGADHVLAPEIVLLYKAKTPGPKDEADFAAVAPELGPEQRSWLRAAIARVHPGHPWLAQLEGA